MKCLNTFILSMSSLLATTFLVAQEPVAIVRGQVVDANGEQPVEGVTIQLGSNEQNLRSTTDSSGYYQLEVPVGLYLLQAQRDGYQEVNVPDVWARSGKQEVQRIAMMTTSRSLPMFTVSNMAREQLAPLGVTTFTVEQTMRTPATTFDPGRMIASFPGVAGVDDGTNHLSIRGNSPNNNSWMLDGVEIVTPNHLTNAGTNSDFPVLSGGGVNILSAQMLGTSQLVTGAAPVQYGNALGGWLDMRLRKGNTQENEWTIQAGLTGLDVSTEGRIGKSQRGSFLANYRYSTVGLLNAIGVDFGDEAITYQDLSFHVALPIGKRGEVRVFGLGGLSSNVFEVKPDTAEWEFDKDSNDITYTSSMGAIGTSIRIPISETATFSTTAILSETDQERKQTPYTDELIAGNTTVVGLTERKLSTMARVDGAAGTRFRYSIGGSAMERTTITVQDNTIVGWLIRPFLDGRYAITEKFQLQAGIGYSYYSFNGSDAIEPRASLAYAIGKGKRISLTGGLRSQLPQYQIMNVYAVDGSGINTDIGLTRSRDLVLGYDHPVNDRLRFHVELYDQELTNVPIASVMLHASLIEQGGTILNGWDVPNTNNLENTGKARNRGVEFSVDHTFANDLFYRANASVFSSTYDYGNEDKDTRWNNSSLGNLVAGKEFRKTKEDRVRTWGISIRYSLAGGQRERGLTLTGTATIQQDLFYAEQLATYQRIDLRIYLKKDRKKRTGLWSLDLQNVAGFQNEAYHYYDQRKGELVTKYQLGLIPNLSYRVEF